MIQLTPNSTPSDVQGAFAIISLLTDDNKYKQRLKELMDTVQAAQELHDKAASDSAAATAKIAEADARMVEVQQNLLNAAAREDAANKLAASAEQRQAELTNLIAKTKADAADAQVQYRQRVEAMNDELARTQAEVKTDRERMEKAAQAKQTELDVAAQALRARESAVLGREKAAEAEGARLKTVADELDAKIAKLRAMVI